MPLLVRSGSIIPAGPAMEYTTQHPQDTLYIHVYTGDDAHFDLYADDGTSYAYEQGAYSIIPMDYTESSGSLIVGDKTGGFTGDLTDRYLRIIWITRSMGVDSCNYLKAGRNGTAGRLSRSNDRKLLKMKRRKFIQTTGLGAGLFTIVPRQVLGKGWVAPSDQLTKAIVGVGGMGTGHIQYEGRLVAICDVDANHLAKASEIAGPRSKLSMIIVSYWPCLKSM